MELKVLLILIFGLWMNNMKRIDRIKKYEEIFDRVDIKLNELEKFLNEKEELLKDIEKLKKYYLGKNWLNDFKADEKNLLPKDLKRGVLSEDGIYNLLNKYDELMEEINGTYEYVDNDNIVPRQ